MVFEFTTSDQDGVAIIKLSGELIDKTQAAPLLNEAENLLKNNSVKWAFDLEELKYMNSSGLNVLIQLLTRSRVSGGEAVLFNLNKKISELLLITKLNTLFKITENKDEALKLLGVA